jgi:hypothetical protein
VNEILIFTEKTSARLSYIFDFVLDELLGLNYQLTSDAENFKAHEGPKFSYAAKPVADEIFFEAAPLLFETEVSLQPLDFCNYNDLTGFYLVSAASQMPFDLFASGFFMLTCYNEYLINKKDKYDRYRASQSMNFKAGFLEKPMINFYALELKNILAQKFPGLQFKQNKFVYQATFDIDIAYSYLEKGFLLNLAGFMRALLLSDFVDFRNRFQVIFRGKKDPFDTYDYILKICDTYQIKTLFFFLLGDRSQFDKNISFQNEQYQQLIQKIADKTDVGIHLSFRSHVSNKLMQREMDRLTKIAGKPILRNRFHYLRFNIPASYLRLMKIGIKEDYSLGHASRIGFRAGTCTPFYFFNLMRNEKTDFKIYPFAFMDSTLNHYNRLSARESLAKILSIIKSVKQVEGPCIGLWHNSTLSDIREWAGWKNVFETTAAEASKLMHEA